MTTTKPTALIRVRDLMTTRLVTLSQGQSLPLADAIMRLRRVRHIPVVDSDRHLVGLVTHRDILAAQISALAPLSDDERSSQQLHVPVARIMQTSVWTVEPETLAVSAARLLMDHRFGCLPVVEDRRLVGIITEADFLELFTTALDLGEPPLPLRVCDVMTPAPERVDVAHTIGDAQRLFAERGIRHLPIVEGEKVVGMISDRDLRIAIATLGGPAQALNVALGVVGTEPPYAVESTANLGAVLLDLAAQRLGSALVLRDGVLVGILTTTDACRHYGEALARHDARPTHGEPST